MTDVTVRLVDVSETVFFGRHRQELCQWITVSLRNDSSATLPAVISISCHGKQVDTPLEIQPGQASYRAFAPLVWPAHPQGSAATLTLDVHTVRQSREIHIGSHRPWVIYLLSDVCSDYLWAYDSVVASCADDAALTLAEIEEAEKAGSSDNHYNLVHARQVEYFCEHYPDQTERLMRHIHQGTIVLNPVYNMSLFGHMTIEEIVRSFYPARRLSRQYGLQDCYANIQETPTAPWGIVTLMRGCGIRHMVRSILPYETPWARRLQEPPLYEWEGPDGSRLAVRLRQQDYWEGGFVLRGLEETCRALHEETLPAYEALGEDYPYSCIALVGCYGDLSPHSHTLPAVKAATVAAYNSQGWEYPRLVNASHRQFWQALTPEIERSPLPVRRGDYGASWEAWPACLAHDFAGWRQAQEKATRADRLTAIVSLLDPAWFVRRRNEIENAWKHLISLADHAWNGAFETNREANIRLRRGWQLEANRAFDRISTAALQKISAGIPTGSQPGLAVFNLLAWPRDGLVWWPADHPESISIKDLSTGQRVPVQAGVLDGKPGLWMMLSSVPALGYRSLAVLDAGHQSAPAQPFAGSDFSLEGPFYRIEVDPLTGGLKTVFDKTRAVDLVDPRSDFSLNQALYWNSPETARAPAYQPCQAIDVSQMQAGHPRLLRVERGESGELFSDLVVHVALADMRIVTTYRLYACLDRLDICNQVSKPATDTKEELDFVFPFNVPDRRYRYETPAAIVEPGVDQLPGAGQAVSAVRRFVDVFNASYGVTLALGECGLIEFGHRTSGEDPVMPDPANSTVLAVALQNCFDWNESIHDQAGVTSFSFRFSLRGHAAGFDPVEALRFAWQMDNDLMAAALPAGQSGDLPADQHSFLKVEPASVVLTGLKPAEAGGLLARLWEVGGQATDAVIAWNGPGELSAAWRADLLESEIEALPVRERATQTALVGCGLTAVRMDIRHSRQK